MNTNAKAVAMTAALLGTACGKSDQDGARSTPSTASDRAAHGIDIPSGLSPEHRVAAEHARDALLAACAQHPIAWSDFQDVSLTTGQALGYLKDRFDWDLMVTVALTFKEGLDRRRSGHRVTFDMGAGRRPGIVTRKAPGIELCGFGGRARGVSSEKPCDPEAGEDCILDVPDLNVLDASRSPAVVQSDRTAPPAWCFAHGFDPPAFWTCAPTDKACRTARNAEKREENGDYRVRSECTRTDSLHCFTIEGGASVCAPDAVTCTSSRKEWTNNNTATPCEVASMPMLTASAKDD